MCTKARNVAEEVDVQPTIAICHGYKEWLGVNTPVLNGAAVAHVVSAQNGVAVDSAALQSTTSVHGDAHSAGLL